MKWLWVTSLLVLTVSLAGNVALYLQLQDSKQISTNQAVKKNASDSLSASGMPPLPSGPSPSNYADGADRQVGTRHSLEYLRGLVRNDNRVLALSLVQEYLRESPLDSGLLILEADILARQTSASDAILHYYELLRYALTEEQRSYIHEQIRLLAAHHMEQLYALESWDVLSDFLEPLWQADPQHRNYILLLAEAYAHQRLLSPMENVLASLRPADPHVLRIRQISRAASETLVRIPEPSADNRFESRGIPLLTTGNQFIVNGQLNQRDVALMIDTGASTTVLTETAFERLGLGNEAQLLGQYAVNTAGGKLVAPMYRLQSLVIADNVVRDIAVIVLPMQEFQADGLLGMNFLREFQFSLDQDASELHLLSEGEM